MNIKKRTIGVLAVALCLLSAVTLLVAIFNSSQDSYTRAAGLAVKSMDGHGFKTETDNSSASVARQKKLAGALPDAGAGINNRPASLIGGHKVAYPGKFAAAHVRVGSQVFELTPNQMGNFQQIQIEPKQKVSVRVAYPEGQPGDPVSIEVKDGGHLNADQMGEVTDLDNQNSVQFQFQATEQGGIYRILLRSGADVKVVNFWVGPLTAQR